MRDVILQFGTSRFLQAHADLFLHEAREAGQDVPNVVVVQTSGDASRAGRLAAFADPNGYPVIIRGLEEGQPVDRTVTVKSVERGLSTARDWAEIVALFVERTEFVLSNTADAGYDVDMSEAANGLGVDEPLTSFPAKLAQLLHARYLAGGRPLTILPCELVNRNGPVLKGLVRTFAAEAGADPDFAEWLDKIVFANTLVDRIVSQTLEPVGAVAEPYALWAIENQPGLTLPCRHPAIMVAEDIEPFERLKLHILNLGHTVLADIWLTEGRPKDETVRAILTDPSVHSRIEAIYRDEVVPGFAAKGMESQARDYVETTLARFLNPYLEHRLSDIAGNHALKIERRLAAFLDWCGRPAPTLQAIIAQTQRTL
jgi:tagaturonate reductase